MPAVTASVTLRISGPLLARVDELALAAGLSRNAWLVGAVERALGDGTVGRHVVASRESVPSESPAPAEQPDVPPPDPDRRRPLAPYRQHVPGPNVENIRSSFQAREFRPYPKGGKR